MRLEDIMRLVVKYAGHRCSSDEHSERGQINIARKHDAKASAVYVEIKTAIAQLLEGRADAT